MTASIFIVAAERSGDELGAGLIRELKSQPNALTLNGIGGAAMQNEGVVSDYDISPLSILGFTEAIRSYPVVRQKVKEAVDLIMSAGPDAVILIDSWGFMLRVAWGLQKAGYDGQIIKYVAPQVWAMREGRAKTLANAVDHLLTIHSFDAPYFERHGLPVHYVGNPVFDVKHDSGDGEEFRRRHKISSDSPVVGILLGSRPSEIQRLAEPMAKAISILQSQYPDLRFISPVSSSVEAEIDQIRQAHLAFGAVTFCNEDEKLDCFAAMDAAIACSGTVTTQLADAGVPTVVTYKLSWLTFAIARLLYKKDYVSIVNIAADEALMPEFLQKDCQGEILANAVKIYLNDPELRSNVSARLRAQTAKMRGEGGRASQRAAKAVIEIIGA